MVTVAKGPWVVATTLPQEELFVFGRWGGIHPSKGRDG